MDSLIISITLSYKGEDDSTRPPPTTNSTSPETNITQHGGYETQVSKLVAQELLGVITFLLAMVTIFGNSVLITIIVKTSQLRTITNGFIISLATSDLIVGLLIMPFCAVAAFGKTWPFSSSFCDFTGFLSSVCGTATVMNLMMVSIDRCIAVSWPLKYNIVMTVPVACVMLAYVWFHSIVFSVLPFMGWGSFDYVLDIFTCSILWHENWVYVQTRNVLCIVVPALVIGAMFINIIRAAQEQRRIFAIMPMPLGLAVMAVQAAPPAINYRRSTLQAMRTLFIIVGILGTLWLPYTVTKLVEHKGRYVSPLLVTSFAWISLLSSTVNPLIFLTNRKFNQRFKELLCKWHLINSGRVAPHDITQNTQSTALPSVAETSTSGSVSIQPRLVPVIDVKANTLMVPKMVSSIPPGSSNVKRPLKRAYPVNLAVA